MALKQYRPTTPGQRQLVLIDRTGLHKGGPVKALTEGKHSSGGRNNTGRIVVRWQGGGHKQRYRLIDVKPGNAMKLAAMPVGTIVHNIEMKPGKGGQVARSAGTYAQYLGRDAGYALLRLNSGEVRKVSLVCMATVGAVSNPDHMNEVIGKAGRNVWKGKRPHVRGTAMNPIDHPHGGGEGRTKGGRHPVTPWGKPTKGGKTRKNKRTTKFIVRTRK